MSHTHTHTHTPLPIVDHVVFTYITSPAAGAAFRRAADIHMELDVKHEAATTLVEAGQVLKKEDPRGEGRGHSVPWQPLSSIMCSEAASCVVTLLCCLPSENSGTHPCSCSWWHAHWLMPGDYCHSSACILSVCLNWHGVMTLASAISRPQYPV